MKKKNTVDESSNDSIGEIMYQGKSLSQWEKDFNGEFTTRQLFQLLKGGVDLGRIKQGLVDECDNIDECDDLTEADSINDKDLFKGEEFFFENDNITESINDIVTVDDFINALTNNSDNDDKIMFSLKHHSGTFVVQNIKSNGGITVVELVDDLINEKDDESKVDEGYNWRRGGYGGTGRKYSSLDNAPRGAAIGWFAVDQLDSKAKGRIAPGWRCGPSNFPFTDLLYPERKYKIGTMVMRNKYIKAGSMSGEKYIAIPSYFEAIKTNDEEAIKLLTALNIPLDLTFGMNPDDDYSITYLNETTSSSKITPALIKKLANFNKDEYGTYDEELAKLELEDAERKGCLIEFIPYCQNCPYQGKNTCPLVPANWEKTNPEFANDELAKAIRQRQHEHHRVK